jgi:putative phage-type endonuclease
MTDKLPEWAADNCEVIPRSQTRTEWLSARTFGITGTDISAIMGANPYKTAFGVWCDKTGQSNPVDDNMAMRIGRIVEPGLRADAMERDGEILESPGCLQSRKNPIVIGNPDGMLDLAPVIYEFKTAGLASRFFQIDPDQWGESGTDLVPIYYLYQCLWYMALTGARSATLVVLLSGEIREYYIRRDDDIIGEMISRAERFWHDHVEMGALPAIDGSNDCSEWLAKKYPHANKGRVIEADGELDELMSRLAKYKSIEKTASEQIDETKAQIQAAMGDAYKVISPAGSVTWTDVKGRNKTDWEAVVSDLGGGLDDILRRTKTGTGYRSFTFRGKK